MSNPSFSWGETLPILSSVRLVLRGLRPADVPALFAVFNDPEVMRYWSSPPLQDVTAAAKLLHEISDHFEHRTLFQWGVARRSDDVVLGTCTLFHVDVNHRRGEIGFALGQADWGTGIMTEALGSLIHFAFNHLCLRRLEADVDPRNLRSIRCLERHGFQREGYLRKRYLVAGELQDSVLFGLLRTEWRDRTAK